MDVTRADDPCCSLECGPRPPFGNGSAHCSLSETGQPCHDSHDCHNIADSCIGYVCQ